jgi:hypothetical protein
MCSLAVIVLAGAMFTGCGDDDGGGGPDLIKVSDFEGSWVASSYRVTSVANPQISLEFVALGGAFGWEADDAGDFTGRAFVPAALTGQSMELPFQGTFDLISQDSILVDFAVEFPPFLEDTRAGFTLEGDTFTITDDNTSFDFDGDQVAEAATFESVLIRYEGSEPSVTFVSDFEGHWEMTSYVMTSALNPQVSIDAVAMGAEFSFDLDDEGNFLGDTFIPASLAGVDVTITDTPGYFNLVTQDTVEVVFTPEIEPFLTTFSGEFAKDGDEMSIISEDETFDFDGDQVEEAAIFEGTMVRTTP